MIVGNGAPGTESPRSLRRIQAEFQHISGFNLVHHLGDDDAVDAHLKDILEVLHLLTRDSNKRRSPTGIGRHDVQQKILLVKRPMLGIDPDEIIAIAGKGLRDGRVVEKYVSAQNRTRLQPGAKLRAPVHSLSPRSERISASILIRLWISSRAFSLSRETGLERVTRLIGTSVRS